MAVGLERTHAQCLGQGEGLAVVGVGMLTLQRRAMLCDLPKEPQGVGFMAPLLMGLGELQRPLRLGIRLVQPAGAADTPRPARPPGAHGQT